MSKDGLPFEFEVPINFFEKADAEPGKQRRIGGLVSTERPDRQGEVILQNGLDFNPFLANGWFNDNHTKETDGILGYPEVVQKVRKGEVLPNGEKSPATGHWAEGYLLNTQRADRIWELGKALSKTKRRLGFSVEGSIFKRTGRLRKTIAKAQVKNVAITNCPVQTDSRLDILAKSLAVVEQTGDLSKAMTMGSPSATAPTGPRTGAGAGEVVTPQSLEHDEDPRLVLDGFQKKKKGDKDDEAKKSLTAEEAVALVKARFPQATTLQAIQMIRLTQTLKDQGRF
jgi:hypothetical protein